MASLGALSAQIKLQTKKPTTAAYLEVVVELVKTHAIEHMRGHHGLRRRGHKRCKDQQARSHQRKMPERQHLYSYHCRLLVQRNNGEGDKNRKRGMRSRRKWHHATPGAKKLSSALLRKQAPSSDVASQIQIVSTSKGIRDKVLVKKIYNLSISCLSSVIELSQPMPLCAIPSFGARPILGTGLINMDIVYIVAALIAVFRKITCLVNVQDAKAPKNRQRLKLAYRRAKAMRAATAAAPMALVLPAALGLDVGTVEGAPVLEGDEAGDSEDWLLSPPVGCEPPLVGEPVAVFSVVGVPAGVDCSPCEL